jgi:nifR3 family TIM-barrel protein
MAGITSLPFRLTAKRLGAGLVTTEMVSAVGLSLGHVKTLRYLETLKDEKPLSVQIFGSQAETMARAAAIVVEAGADLVDINLGCPARKVFKTGAGGGLLRDLPRLGRIVSAVRKACPRPLTAKMRTGWSPGEANFAQTARILEDCGVDAITVHPRFVTQGFSGRADWKIISEIKEQSGIPVIGNGDVFAPHQALALRRETGCDGVMIGRGALGNPWIFRQVLDLEKGLPIHAPSLDERKAVILEHFHLMARSMDEAHAARVMRGILLWYTRGLPRASAFRGRMTSIRDLASLVETLDAYFGDLARQSS